MIYLLTRKKSTDVQQDYLREMFPGCLNKKGVYIHGNELPGLGININININEKLAAKYPVSATNRNPVRQKDGTIIIS